MTRFLTLFDTAVTDPLEDIPTVNELEKWLKNVGEQAFYFLIRLAAAGLLLFIGSKLIKFLMNRFKRSKLYQKMDPGLASFMASGSRIVLYIILILMCFGVLGIETASFLALFTSGGVAIGLAFQGAVTNLAGGVMIVVITVLRALAINKVPKKTFLLLWAAALLRLLVSMLVTVLGLVNKLPVIGTVNRGLGWLVGGATALLDIYLVLCILWGIIVITGGNLNVLNDTVMSSSLYYKIFNLFNPFL